MVFSTSNPTTVGDATKKTHYDTVFDNTIWLKAYCESYPNTGNFDARVKAWIHFNGTGVIAIQDSFNVTSITDNGVGDYTVTWNTDFANVDYSCVATQSNGAGIACADTYATGTIQITTYLPHTITYYDDDDISVIAIGDQ